MYIVSMYRICHELSNRRSDARLPGLAAVHEVAGGRRPGRRAAGADPRAVLTARLAVRHAAVRGGPVSSRLADHTGLEPLYVSKLARALEAAGLVERLPDPSDTRAVQLSLTDQGRDVTRRAIDVVQQLLDRLLEPLGGLEGPRAEVFSRELAVLLDTPLDIPAKE